VHQRVGFERDQGVDVVGGGDADRCVQAADVADVAAHLVRVADAHTHQLEQRMLDDLGITIRPTKPVPHTMTLFETLFASRCDIRTSAWPAPGLTISSSPIGGRNRPRVMTT